MARGKFILVMGPTGSGKSVLMSSAREHFPELLFAHTYTTRAKRPGYENASYLFITPREFEEKAQRGEFLEWAHFGEDYYGTPKAEVTSALEEGKVLMKEMDIQGIRQVQEQMPGDVVLMYIDGGTWEELEQRARARAPITDEQLAKRKQRYEDEYPLKEVADFVISNPSGGLEEATKAFLAAIGTVIESSTRA